MSAAVDSDPRITTQITACMLSSGTALAAGAGSPERRAERRAERRKWRVPTQRDTVSKHQQAGIGIGYSAVMDKGEIMLSRDAHSQRL